VWQAGSSILLCAAEAYHTLPHIHTWKSLPLLAGCPRAAADGGSTENPGGLARHGGTAATAPGAGGDDIDSGGPAATVIAAFVAENV
jgi:hypothetical protein